MENENELDEDAKMGKQSDDNLKSMMKKFRDMEKKDPKEPSTKFMIKPTNPIKNNKAVKNRSPLSIGLSSLKYSPHDE